MNNTDSIPCYTPAPPRLRRRERGPRGEGLTEFTKSTIHRPRWIHRILLWFIICFAPGVCIFHCHVWPWLGPARAGSGFICRLNTQVLQQQASEPTPTRAQLPRVVVDTLLPLALLATVTLAVARVVAVPLLMLHDAQIAPPTPPPRRALVGVR